MIGTRRSLLTGGLAGLLLIASMPAVGRAQESRIVAEFRREGEHLKDHCSETSLKAISGCVMATVTSRPVHLAMGSLAPGNGFGLGAAFLTSHSPSESWRLSWNADAVKTFGGSWRTGVYMKLIHTNVPGITVVTPGDPPSRGDLGVRTHAVIDLYAQTTTLRMVSFYGLGPDSSRDARAVFGLRHAIVGGSAIVPVAAFGLARALNLALLGELKGRFVDVRPGSADDGPLLDVEFSDTEAPGLTDQPKVFQLGEGVRIKPSLGNGHLRLNYMVRFQQYLASAESQSAFRRWTVDLDHEIPLYTSSTRVTTGDVNGPNDCATTIGGDTCAPISRNRQGAIVLRAMTSRSAASAGHRVPFYFQPTLGGHDINGLRALAGFDDYRFRAPNILLLQESIEHSIYGPVGVFAQAEQGTVALDGRDLGLGDLKRSYSAGLSLRAGGFPQVIVSYGWGGGEGRHFAAVMQASVLGGGARVE